MDFGDDRLPPAIVATSCAITRLPTRISSRIWVGAGFQRGQREQGLLCHRRRQPERRGVPRRAPLTEARTAHTASRPSSTIGSPSAVSRPPWRRSQIRSQCTADSFVPPVSGYERPSARWTVPPIFSSNRIAPDRAVDAEVRADARARRGSARPGRSRASRCRYAVAALGARADDLARRGTRARRPRRRRRAGAIGIVKRIAALGATSRAGR